MTSQKVRTLTGRLSVWAQVNHPVGTANLMRKLTSSSSHKKKAPTGPESGPKVAGLAAADAAAKIPHPITLADRTDGIALANRAARIPGTF
ncbi:hypothetical protein L1O03_10190 [Corynebacterium uropygiale]|uniref:Uncharacterized protein n=1 Tax=Corynebacterium uropygiale TaxID=1775911 RepID=A0A9X1U1G2_9CORY|nr:hypothetical protein [Corynebacterium uropygiale]MCF4007533.1 hypothetical protein [Corynebacterium uropygiale]